MEKGRKTCVKSVKYLQNKHTNKQNIIIKNLTFINYTTKKNKLSEFNKNQTIADEFVV